MIIFLYGQNTFGSRQKLTELKEKYLKEVDASGNSVSFINGETCNIGDIHQVTSTATLFSEKKMLIIENIFANQSKTLTIEVLPYITKLNNSEDVIIFIDNTNSDQLKTNKLFKTLLKQKFVQEFKNLNSTEIIGFVKNYVKNNNSNIDEAAARKMQLLLDNNLWDISNNLDKLLAYKNGDKITLEDVDKNVKGKVTDNIFSLIDAISLKNKKQALTLFEQELEAGQTESYLFHMILRQFKILLQVKKELDEGRTAKQIANKLKLHPFVAQKSSTQAANFDLSRLKNIFNYLLKLDSDIKTNKTTPTVALELLIGKL